MPWGDSSKIRQIGVMKSHHLPQARLSCSRNYKRLNFMPLFIAGLKLAMHRLFVLCCFIIFLARPATVKATYVLKPVELHGESTNKAIYDAAGMLWILTNGSLCRYDGAELIKFPSLPGFTLAQHSVSVWLADKNNRIWLGTQNGLLKIDLVSWTIQQIKNPGSTSGVSITAICEMNDGTIVAGTDNGLLMKERSGRLIPLPGNSNNGVAAWQDMAILRILEIQPGNLHAFNCYGDAMKLNVNDPKPYYYNLQTTGKLLISRSGFGWDRKRNKLLFTVLGRGNFEMDMASYKISKLSYIEDAVYLYYNDETTGDLYAVTKKTGTKTTLNIYDITEGRNAGTIYNLKEHVGEMTVSNGRVLMAYGTGLAVLLNRNLQVRILKDDFTPTSSVRSIFGNSDSVLYISSYRYGITSYDLRTETGSFVAKIHPYTFFSWNKDSVLLGTEGGGLMWFHLPDAKVADWKNRDNSAAVKNVTEIYKIDDGTLLIGTYRGVFVVDIRKQAFTALASEDSGQLMFSRIYDIMPGTWGQFFFATDKGIWSWSKGLGVKSFNTGGDLGYAVESDTNYIYSGSYYTGLSVLDHKGKIVSNISMANGLAGNTVFDLTSYKNYLIAGTENGLSLVRKGDWKIKNLTTVDGLPAPEINHSSFFISDSILFSGTTSGAFAVNLEELIRTNKNNDTVSFFVTGIMLNTENGKTSSNFTFPYKKGQRIEVPAGTRSFSLSIAADMFSDFYGRLYYRLSKNDHWQQTGNNYKISFFNMPPGDYELEIAAQRNTTGNMSFVYRTELTILPLWHQLFIVRMLFLFFFVLLLFGLTWIFFRIKARRLEKEKQMRVKIAGDLHDEVGSILTGISMQAQMLLIDNTGSGDNRTFLQNMISSSRAAIHTMSDIVWSIDPNKDDNLNLLERMKYYASKTLKPVGIAIEFDDDANTEKLFISQQLRQSLMLIFKEQLNNITKHSGATVVRMSLTQNKHTLVLAVTDNGIGLQDAPKGNGLVIMMARVKALKGDIIFDSVVPNGLRICVTVPLEGYIR